MEMWDVIRQNVRAALRGIRRTPGVSAAIVFTLALGIGANAMMFGVIDRLLLSPPQHLVQADRLELLYLDFGRQDGLRSTWRRLTFPDFQDIAHLPAFESAAAYGADVAPWTLGSGTEARRVRVQQATASFFPTLGVRPARGRFYTSEDDAPGARLTAVLSEEFWTREMGRDPGVLGRVLQLNRGQYEVIGVAPAGFTGVELNPVDVWLPLRASAVQEAGTTEGLEDRGMWWVKAVVRVKAGIGAEAADAQLTTAHLAARRSYEQAGGKPYLVYQEHQPPHLFTASVIAERGPTPSRMSSISTWLAGVSVVVLLIACANVANLLLARGVRAQQELAIRVALGASRQRLVTQLMTETAVLAGAGALAAWGLAWWSGRAVHALLVPDVAFTDAGMNLRLVLFIAVAAGTTAGLAGLLPSLQASRTTGADALRAVSRGNSSSRSALRNALMIGQITFSVVLLVGAGLFVRSLWQALQTDVGFNYTQTLNVTMEDNTDLEWRTARRVRRRELFREALQRVQELPGVRAAALSAATLPLAGRDGFGPEELRIPGVDAIPQLPGGGPVKYSGTEDFFALLDLTVTRGRAFDRGEFKDGAEPVSMINETMARTLWPHEDPLSKCLVYNDPDTRGVAGPCRRIVGVFKDFARLGLSEPKVMQIAYPTARDAYIKGMVVRADGDPAALIPSIRQAFAGVSPDVRFVDVRANAERFDALLGPWRTGSTMFAAFGLLALLVAAVGLYSVLAFSVAQRRRELGIRAALGANRRHLIRIVMTQAARLLSTGLVLGTVAALVAGRFMRDLLFGIQPTDASVYALVVLTLIAVGALAGAIPAWRATSIDPTTAMQLE